MNVYKVLQEKFPSLSSKVTRSTRKKIWQDAKSKNFLGEQVSGEVILATNFGAFLAVGDNPFPFLLLYAKSTKIPQLFKEGDYVKGSIYVFNDDSFQIGITQKPREKWMEGEW